jgi:hypothetical protein
LRAAKFLERSFKIHILILYETTYPILSFPFDFEIGHAAEDRGELNDLRQNRGLNISFVKFNDPS